MLNVYIPEFMDLPKDKTLIADVEECFSAIRGAIPDCDVSRKLINYIEQGQYLDEGHFIDRFGNKLSMNNLSTGCKAGLCVYCFPDKLISTIECGANAITAIIWYCRHGNITIPFDYRGLCSFEAPSIDVRVGNYRFTEMLPLIKYIEDTFPDAPDLAEEGISSV